MPIKYNELKCVLHKPISYNWCQNRDDKRSVIFYCACVHHNEMVFLDSW
jgi:hypothetical protein